MFPKMKFEVRRNFVQALSSITIEPVIFLSTFGLSLISGSEITKKMILSQGPIN